MRFGTSRRPAPYLNPRDQWRMLRLVGLLAIALVAMNVAADPDTWAWMFPDESPAGATGRGPSLQQVDFGVEPDDPEGLPPGVFRSEVAPENEAPAEPGETPDAGDSAKCRDVRIEPERLAHIRDNTLGVRKAEADAFYAALARARDLPQHCLKQVARADVAFTVLMADSEHFRGVPITVTGEIKRLSLVEASANQYGIASFYEVWLFTPDSGDNPYRIVTVTVPDGLPQGDIDEEVRVRVTGYFFKREGYASEGGLHTAPLLIGKMLERLRPRPAGIPAAPHLPLAQSIVAVVAIIAVLLGVLVWWFSRSDRKFKREHLDRLATSSGENPSALNDVQASDPGEHLKRLAESEGDTTGEREG